MSYKRTVKKGEKSYGPYVYESYRDENGVVKKRYLGKVEEKSSKKPLISLLITVSLIVLVFASLSFDNPFQNFVEQQTGLTIKTIFTGLTIDDVDSGDSVSEDESVSETGGSSEIDSSEIIQPLDGELEDTQNSETDIDEVGSSSEPVESIIEIPEESFEESLTLSENVPESEVIEETEEPVEVNESEEILPIINETNEIVKLNETEIINETFNESIEIIVNETINETLDEGFNESLNESLNETFDENLTEEIPEIVIPSNESFNLVYSEGVEIVQYEAVINRPVKWIVIVNESDFVNKSEIYMELPQNAEDINVLIGKEVDLVIEEKEKYKKLVDDASSEKIVSGLLTGNVVLDLNSEKTAFERFLERLSGFFRTTGNVISEVELEQGEKILREENKTTVDLTSYKDVKEKIAITYYTPAPTSIEEEINGEKIVVISSDEEGYENVKAYTTIDNSLKIKDKSKIKILWFENVDLIENECRDCKSKNVNDFVVDDTNNDGYIDYIEWVVPHLSTQSYKVLIAIREAYWLDENRTIIEDVYDKVNQSDGVYQVIPEGDYLRVIYEVPLTNEGDTVIRANASEGTTVEMYEKDSDVLLVTFTNITNYEKNRLLLDMLPEGYSQDTFDLWSVGGDVSYDLVYDADDCSSTVDCQEDYHCIWDEVYEGFLCRPISVYPCDGNYPNQHGCPTEEDCNVDTCELSGPASCVGNVDCNSNEFCNSSGYCQADLSSGANCDYNIVYDNSATTSNQACSSGYCRDDYDTGNADGDCDSGDQCYCADSSTDCVHNGVSVNTGTYASGVCYDSFSRWRCTNGDWGGSACSPTGYICTSGTCSDCSATSDCPSGYNCLLDAAAEGYICTTQNCQNNYPYYFGCQSGETCVPFGNGDCYVACTSNSDCSSGYFCNNSQLCQADLADGATCVGITYSNSSSEENGACTSGRCDNDGVGAADDNKCYSVVSTYFDSNDNNCEYDIGNIASISADEKTPSACDGSNGYVSSTCEYFSNGDSNSDTCTCVKGSGYWNLGGEVSATTCCGDDANEYKRTRVCESGSGCTSSSSDDACCSDSTDCVYNSVCYSSTTMMTAPWNSNLRVNCEAGVWYLTEDCSTKSSTDSDGGNVPGTAGTVTDYTNSGSSSCNYNQYSDTCTSTTTLTEYYNSGASYGSQSYTCSDFFVAASGDTSDDPTTTGTCTAGTAAGCADNKFYTLSGSSGTEGCVGTCGTGTNSCYFREYYGVSASAPYFCSGLYSCTAKTYDADTNSNTCSACRGAGYWNLGGEVSATTCCGDDANEYKRTRLVITSPYTMDNGYTSNPGDDACCSANTKCVDGGTCYTGGSTSHDADGDGDNDYCYTSGYWTDCIDNTGCSGNYYCSSNNCINTCSSDSACTQSGYGYCTDGTCSSNECSATDLGNCAANEYCSSGSCTDSCDENADCPSGYFCKFDDMGNHACSAVLSNGEPCNMTSLLGVLYLNKTEDDGACSSGYCDNDGVGADDDYHCYTPSGSDLRLDNMDGDTCEYDTGVSMAIFADEKMPSSSYSGSYSGCPSGSTCWVSSNCFAYDGDASSTTCNSLDGTWTTVTTGDIAIDSNSGCSLGVSCGDGIASNGFCCGDDTYYYSPLETDYIEQYVTESQSFGSDVAFVDGEGACCYGEIPTGNSRCVANGECYSYGEMYEISPGVHTGLNPGGNDTVSYCWGGDNSQWLDCDDSDNMDYWCGSICGPKKGVKDPRDAGNPDENWNAISAGASGVGEYPDSYTLGCCGDDANEHYIVSNVLDGLLNNKACCNTSTDCVFQDICYSYGSGIESFSGQYFCGSSNDWDIDFAGGDGSLNNPFEISNCIQLQNMNSNLTAHYKLINNVDCSNTVNWNSGKGFVPIGGVYDSLIGSSPNASYFLGTLDGSWNNITNIYINRPNFAGIGLIGFSVSNDGPTVYNLTIIDSVIRGNGATGSIGGYNVYGEGVKVINSQGCTLGGDSCGVYGPSGSVILGGQHGSIGGLFGTTDLSKNLNNSIYIGDVSASNNDYVGGLVGYSHEIYNCSFSGSVTGADYVGGVMGKGSEISDSYSMGSVSGGGYVGGLIGYSDGNVWNSYSSSTVSGTSSVGGLVGKWASSSYDINESFSVGSVSGTSSVGSLVGSGPSTQFIYNSYWLNHSNNPNVAVGTGSSAGTTVQTNDYYFYNSANAPLSSWDFTNIWGERANDYPVFQTDDYCGDSSGEYIRENNWDTGDRACCSSSNACVDGGACYLSGALGPDVNGDGNTDFCLSGEWVSVISPTINGVIPLANDALNSEKGRLNITFLEPAIQQNGISYHLLGVGNSLTTYIQTDTWPFSYLHSGLDDNYEYCYKVRYYDYAEGDYIGDWSDTVCNITLDRTGPAAPSVDLTNNPSSGIDLRISEGDEGLILYMPFEEGSGSTTYDWSPEGNDGTMHNFESEDWISGKLGNGGALEFGGNSESEAIFVGPVDSLSSLSNDFTVSLWARFDNLSAYRETLISSTGHSGSYGTRGWKIWNSNGAFYFSVCDGDPYGDCSTKTYSINDNNWHYLTALWNATAKQVTIYVDGINKGSATGTDLSVTSNGYDLVIGGNDGGSAPTGHYFDGGLDEIKIYSTLLTQREIINDMQSGLIKKNISRSDSLTGSYSTIEDNLASNIYSDTGVFDNAAPNQVTGLSSTSHTTSRWSNDASVDFSWTAATDGGTPYYYYANAFDSEGNSGAINLLSLYNIDWTNPSSWSSSTGISWDTTEQALKVVDYRSVHLDKVYIPINTSKKYYLEYDIKQVYSGTQRGSYSGTHSYAVEGGSWLPGHPGSYDYFVDSDSKFTNNTWVHRRNNAIAGEPRTGESSTTSERDKWHTGTNYATIMFLFNYNGAGQTTYIKNLKFYEYEDLKQDDLAKDYFGVSINYTSGVDGYSFHPTCTETKSKEESVTAASYSFTNNGTSNYIYMKTKDNAGNWGNSCASSGPYWICTGAPLVDSDDDDSAGTVSLTDSGNTCGCTSSDNTSSCDNNFDGTKDGICCASSCVGDINSDCCIDSDCSSGYNCVSNDCTDITLPSVGTPTMYSGTYSGTFFKPTIGVRATVSDSGSGLNTGTCQVSWNNGGSWAAATYSSGYCQASYTGTSNIQVKFRINDTAGNTGTSTASSFTYDGTAPTTTPTGTAPAGGASYTYNTWTKEASVGTTLSCSDGTGSGCASIKYCTDTSNSCTPTTTYSSRVDISTEGTNYIRYYSTDNLGNVETTKSSTIKIDKTAPTTSGAITSGTMGSNGWYITNVGYTITPADALSGVASTVYCTDTTNTCTPSTAYSSALTLSTEGNNYVRFRTTDNAGNVQTIQSSGLIKIDKTAPSCSLSSISESSSYAHVSGSTVFYNTASTGSFAVTTTASDSTSGIQKVNFPTTVSAGADDTSSPYSQSYSWDGSDTYSQAATVTCYDNAGLTNTHSFTVTKDTTAPTGGNIKYTDGYYTTASVSITYATGTDSQAGLNTASGKIQRQSATLSTGSCGTFGSWGDLITEYDGSHVDSTVTSGNCYKYRYVISDNVLNTATYTNTSVVKVDTSAPATPTINYFDGYIKVTNNTVTFSSTDAQSGISSYTLYRRSATLSSGSCGTFGSWSSLGTKTSPYSDTVTNGNCYQYYVTVTNNAGLTASSTTSPTATTKVDTTNPSISYTSPTPADSSRQTANSVTISATVSDAGSGVDKCVLEWNSVNQTVNPSGGTCSATKSTTDGTTYTFKMYVNDSAGNWNSEAQRSFRENAKPSITSAVITPSSPTTIQDLTCTVSGWSDADSDSANYYFEWYKNSVKQFTNYKTGTTDVVNSGNLTSGDTWNCTVIPYDGYENGTAKSDSVVIEQACYIDRAATLSENLDCSGQSLIITSSGELNAGSYNVKADNATVDGKLVSGSGIFNITTGTTTVGSTGNITAGTGDDYLAGLTIASGGSYSATSGTTLIDRKSITSGGGIAFSNSGNFNHNFGTFIFSDSAGRYHWISPGTSLPVDPFYNVIIDGYYYLSDGHYIWVEKEFNQTSKGYIQYVSSNVNPKGLILGNDSNSGKLNLNAGSFWVKDGSYSSGKSYVMAYNSNYPVIVEGTSSLWKWRHSGSSSNLYSSVKDVIFNIDTHFQTGTTEVVLVQGTTKFNNMVIYSNDILQLDNSTLVSFDSLISSNGTLIAGNGSITKNNNAYFEIDLDDAASYSFGGTTISYGNNTGSEVIDARNAVDGGNNVPAGMWKFGEISVDFIEPEDNYISGTSVFFKCNASGDANLVNMTLYHNSSGSWSSKTNDVSGTSTSSVFNISGATGNFNWYCGACDDYECATTLNNRSVVFDGSGPTVSIDFPVNESYTNKDYMNLKVSTTDDKGAFTFINDSSLLGYWSFDEISGTIVSDSSGNGNSGAFVGDAHQWNGYFGNGGEFDGTGDYVSVGGVMNGVVEFTISTWIKTTQTYGHSTGYSNPSIVGVQHASGFTTNDFALLNIYGNLGWWDEFNGGYQAAYNTGHSISDGEWHHVLVKRIDNGASAGTSTMMLYDNGVNVGNFTSNGRGAIERNIRIGYSYTNPGINGSLDEVLIFDRALSDDEISALYNSTADQYKLNATGLSEGANNVQVVSVDRGANMDSEIFEANVDTTNPLVSFVSPTPANNDIVSVDSVVVNVSSSDNSGNHSTFVDWNNSLIGWWRMDDVSGSTVIDYTGNNNGTITGDVHQMAGVRGDAMSFDGAGDYISIPSLNPTEAVTVSGWFRKEGSPGLTHHILYMQGTQVEISIPDSTGKIRAGVTTTTSRQVFDDGSGITDGDWHHLSMTYNGSKLLSYIDGVQVGSHDITGGDITTGSSTNIGYYSGGYYANGSIDDVMVFDRALSEDEIKSIYNAQATQYYNNFTGLESEGEYSFKAYAQDMAGNVNETEERSITINLEVNDCGDITEAGTYYLANDVSSTGTCFNILADNITLDCQGNSINFSSTSTGFGIKNQGYDFVEIKNCTIQLTNEALTNSRGINLYDSPINNSIVNSNIYIPTDGSGARYNYGMILTGAQNTTVENNTVEIDISGWNGYYNHGIYLGTGSSNIVKSNNITVSGYGGYGIRLASTSNNLIEGNNIETIAEMCYGIHLESSSSNEFYNNSIITREDDGGGNTAHGVHLESGNSNIFRNNDVVSIKAPSYVIRSATGTDIDSSNTAEGFPVWFNNSLNNHNFNGNDFSSYGQVICSGCSNVNYTDVTVKNDGLLLIDSANCSILNSYIEGNYSHGLFLYNGDDNYINNTNITALASSVNPLKIRIGSDRNLFENNNIYSTNGEFSAYIQSSNYNTFFNNDFSATSYSVFFYGGVNYHNFTKNNVSGSVGFFLDSQSSTNSTFEENIIVGTAGNAIYAQRGNNNYIFKDNDFSGGKVHFSSNSNHTVNMTNTINYGTPSFSSGSSGRIYIYSYLDVKVNDTQGNIQNANVTAWNVDNTLQFSELTNSTGQIEQKTLYVFYKNDTYSKDYSNFTLNVTDTSYAPETRSIDLSESQSIVITFTVGDPSLYKFELEDSTGAKSVYIDDKGDMYLKGNLFTGQTISSVPTNSFIIQNSAGSNVGYFTDGGSLYLAGTVEIASSLTGAGNKLEFRNSTDHLVAFIDESGNMKLKGGYVTSYSF